jgi:hypothetical protein
LVSDWLHRAPTPLPQVWVLVQQVPTSPGPARRGPATEQNLPPVQLQVCPTASPGKRVKVGLGLVLHWAPAAPVAPNMAQVVLGRQVLVGSQKKPLLQAPQTMGPPVHWLVRLMLQRLPLPPPPQLTLLRQQLPVGGRPPSGLVDGTTVVPLLHTPPLHPQAKKPGGVAPLLKALPVEQTSPVCGGARLTPLAL